MASSIDNVLAASGSVASGGGLGGGSLDRTPSGKISAALVYFAVDAAAPTPEYSEHRFVERVHAVARSLHGVVHHFIGGAAVVSWNAVRHTAASESKAARFLHTLSTFAGDAHIKVYGAAVTGRARCHLAGDRNKAVVLTAEWWPTLLELATTARRRRSMVIDGATKTAVFYEYVLRGFAAFDANNGGGDGCGGDGPGPGACIVAAALAVAGNGARNSLSGSDVLSADVVARDRGSSFSGGGVYRTATGVASASLVLAFELLSERHQDNVEWLFLFQRAREGIESNEAAVKETVTDIEALSCVALELATTGHDAEAARMLSAVGRIGVKHGGSQATVDACRVMLDRLESAEQPFPYPVRFT